jgi:hypothetical protein
MSPRMAKTHVVTVFVIFVLFCGLAVACVAPVPPCPPGAPAAQTELDRAYYDSTINQQMVYAKLGENGALAAAAATPPTLLPAGIAATGCLSVCPLLTTTPLAPTPGFSPAPTPRTSKSPHHRPKTKGRDCRPAAGNVFDSCHTGPLSGF